MQTFKKIIYLLNTQERRRAVLLMFMIFTMALFDMIGVASILPFMTVISNPEAIETNYFLNKLFHISKLFGVENNQQFLFTLGVILLVLLIISLSFKALTTYAQVRFVQMREYSISKRLVEGYLHQPYSWFLNRNSADLGKTILSEVQQVIGNGMTPLMSLISHAMVSMGLILVLLLTDPMLTLIIIILLGTAYGFIYIFVQKFLRLIGLERLKNNELRFLSINEAFGAAKEVKVGGLEDTFIERFSKSAKIFGQKQASAVVVGLLPRFALEAIAFGVIILIILFLMSQKGDFNNALPIISLYVFAGYRLMPSLQGVYSSVAQLTFVGPSLNKLHDDLKNIKLSNANQGPSNLSFNSSIALKNINYSYPNASRKSLKNISLTIPAKTTVGIVGKTGSGKTTIVDIILGLLEPQNGTLEVDNMVINQKNSKTWRKCIGYVPQHIYLADDTIAANIAFGVDPKNINNNSVEKASKIANLHNFVINELPQKYQSKIGERGVRLSGGQRQRIGIARALYHNPKVLIFDEATSSLDNETEKSVMDAVNNLGKDITIIMIAHRLNTVKICDIIFKIENGELIGEGNFNQIIDKIF